MKIDKIKIIISRNDLKTLVKGIKCEIGDL